MESHLKPYLTQPNGIVFGLNIDPEEWIAVKIDSTIITDDYVLTWAELLCARLTEQINLGCMNVDPDDAPPWMAHDKNAAGALLSAMFDARLQTNNYKLNPATPKDKLVDRYKRSFEHYVTNPTPEAAKGLRALSLQLAALLTVHAETLRKIVNDKPPVPSRP